MDKPRLVNINNEPEVNYVNPECSELWKYVGEWVGEVGCTDMIIIVRDGDNYFSEWFATTNRSEEMLGTLERVKHEYLQELTEAED